MYAIFLRLLLAVVLGTSSCVAQGGVRRRAEPTVAAKYITGIATSPASNLFLEDIQGSEITNHNVPHLYIDASQSYQTIDGFGFTLTGGSAQHFMEMHPSRRTRLLRELFGELNISVMRVSIGASDLDPDPYSLDDVWMDVDLAHFSMERELRYKIPLLKEMYAINPKIQLMGTPWSAPFWMKDNEYTAGGSLKPEMFAVYARYLVKYLQAMQNEGLPLHSMTIQNEPLNWKNNPSMYMLGPDQGIFIKDHLAPAMAAAGLSTKLIIFDHNLDYPEYAVKLLNDPDLKKLVVGSAFHMYSGTIDSMGYVHWRHPDRDVYFTEQFMPADGNFEGVLMWHAKNIWIGGLNNWAKQVMEWNLSSNPSLTPHTIGGCSNCNGAITIDGNNVQRRNVAYFLMAHASPYILPGSVRIGSWISDSETSQHIDHVAVQSPNGETVVLLANHYWFDNPIIVNGQQVTLPRLSVVTLIL